MKYQDVIKIVSGFCWTVCYNVICKATCESENEGGTEGYHFARVPEVF